ATPSIQSRIIGGWECERHSQPWQVAVCHNNTFKCGGALIHPQWVLTATHCISNNYQLFLGRHSLSRPEHSGQRNYVSQSFPHPNFNMSLRNKQFPGADYSHDLMLLRLAWPVLITDTVKVVDLPTKDPKMGSSCFTSGWGSPSRSEILDSLQCVDLNILPNDNCGNTYLQKVTKFMLCTGHLKGGKATCQGDSGSPLVCNGVLQGIASWGAGSCSPHKFPSVFARLTLYLDWIRNTMVSNS
uniref:Kallikrein-1-like n=1 Tax=Nannospalax galili TaxID=1026970 RepID=A0A8C6W2R3_NANGA